MKRKLIWIASGLLIAVVLVIAGINEAKNETETAETAEIAIGSTKAATDKHYTLEEMLIYGIQDEYMAHAEYDKIMDKYGVQKPFSNIIQAEERHIEMLLPLFEAYDIAVPKNDAENRIVVPESLEECYTVGVEAEEKNIAMYASFLKEDLPTDVRDVFERLLDTSENHLAAFERAANGEMGLGNGKESDKGNHGHRYGDDDGGISE